MPCQQNHQCVREVQCIQMGSFAFAKAESLWSFRLCVFCVCACVNYLKYRGSARARVCVCRGSWECSVTLCVCVDAGVVGCSLCVCVRVMCVPG